MTDTRKIENLHVSLWLLKDMSWCASWHWMGIAMVLPTLIVAIRISWDSRAVLEDLVHNLAVCLWICANITWMIGEFFLNDGTRPYAKMFFYAGMALLVLYYTKSLLARTWSARRFSL